MQHLPSPFRGGAVVASALLLCACAGDVEPAHSEVEPAQPEPRDASRPRDAEADAADARSSAGDAAIALDAGGDAARASDAAGSVDASLFDAGVGCSELPFARGLAIRELALYQTVKIPLYRDGAWGSDSPIVAGKKALLRVFAELGASYVPHRVRAVLELSGKAGTTRLRDDRTLTESSRDAEPQSTFSFALEGNQIEPETQLSVSLYETECNAQPGRAADVRVPQTGSRSLGADAIGKLKVVVLPIDVGGRLPKTDRSEQQKIRDAILAYFPVSEVELSVRSSPLSWSGSFGGNDSSAWSNLLNQVLRVRNGDNAASDVYYYGLMQPAASFAAFCGRGCTVGMAPETTRVSPSEQAGLSVYFTEREDVARTSLETIVHELGHAHGRGHAPCVEGGTIRGVDTQYPERNGATGEWGWDSRSDTLIPPTHKDVMGYCSPDWISPYTYAALAERSLRVNSLRAIGAVETSWHRVILYRDGSARWGGSTVADLPGGDLESARVLDSAGREIATTQIGRVRIAHSEDLMLYLPTAPAEWATLLLPDRTLTLDRIEAPL